MLDWRSDGFINSFRVKVLSERWCSAHMHNTDFNTDFSITPNLRNVICVEDGSAFNVR